MPLPVYMDVHVPAGVSEGLRRKRIDVLTAHEDSARQMSDEELLTRATALGRVLFTQDNDFLEIAARWQRRGLAFSGLVFALACLGNPDPGDMKVYCPEGKETFDDDETTEEAPS